MSRGKKWNSKQYIKYLEIHNYIHVLHLICLSMICHHHHHLSEQQKAKNEILVITQQQVHEYWHTRVCKSVIGYVYLLLTLGGQK